MSGNSSNRSMNNDINDFMVWIFLV